ncbi:hypothetical protein K2173_003793 [Erythroxylum novogranatense]|uniref:Nijmegen breakage syndrome 1 protein n=1 Tax=Erythroxylum novogranatense TaxID=1862640 RepID=A0AAV8SIY5_9ROSI|nr:hypothetical protein K2173_003793 [Erythroxylum novogranatense]
MVWALSPADPLSGEERYYIFTKGSYKVGRKGCDVIINKDKGVSRVHAEILVDEMISSLGSTMSTKARIRDCSKYGTFINRNLGAKDKVHEFPNKEITLKNGDLVSFGAGNATYRFSFVPHLFFLYCAESFQVNDPLQEKISSIGAQITYHFSKDCTHVLVDELMPVKEDLLEAIVAKKPVVLKTWVEFMAGKGIVPEIPNWTSFLPKLTVDGVSVKIVDSGTRADCLKGYTFVLESSKMYKSQNRLQSLLESAGSNIMLIEELCSNSQGLDYGGNGQMVCVIPSGSVNKLNHFSKCSSLARVNEADLLCAVLSGCLDSSILTSPCVAVSSSCSTDETVVADSDAELETATSTPAHADIGINSPRCTNNVGASMDLSVKSEDRCPVRNVVNDGGMRAKLEKNNEPESGNCDVIYSQDLITKDLSLPFPICSTSNIGVMNFKHFRKRNTQSGNSFNNLVPFSKYPYKESDCETDKVLESVKEEKKRKQMEAIAEDLFKNEKARKRGVAGSLRGLLIRG